MYVKGKILKRDKKAVAIVGSRTPSERGKALAFDFSFVLANEGYTIISGMARGIDTIAHKGALVAGGRTIAVLGSGLDIIYPPENKSLGRAIIKNGALVSPFPYGAPPNGKNFLARNRIIAELSLAILVVEGKRRSGTLSTASWAADLGREVFAIPGSEATDWLIEQGATAVKRPIDLINLISNLPNFKEF